MLDNKPERVPIKYGDIPSRDTCAKLSMVSFESPSKNLKVYKFCEALRVCQDFIENERNKLLDKYGVEEEPGKYKVEVAPYNAAVKELLALEVTEEIPKSGLTESDFDDSVCQYPTRKEFWLNATDIRTVIEFEKKLHE